MPCNIKMYSSLVRSPCNAMQYQNEQLPREVSLQCHAISKCTHPSQVYLQYGMQYSSLARSPCNGMQYHLVQLPHKVSYIMACNIILYSSLARSPCNGMPYHLCSHCTTCSLTLIVNEVQGPRQFSNPQMCKI